MHPSKIDWRLVAIIDRAHLGGRDLPEVAEALISGGAGVLQLRDKSGDTRRFFADAALVCEIGGKRGVPVIINDRADVALAAGADGVHVGQEDLPPEIVRNIVGDDKIIGVSVHNTEEFQKMVGGTPSYFGVGAIYPTRVKSHLSATGVSLIAELRRKTMRPLIAIGGITVDNLETVIAAGANGVAVISNLLSAPDIEARARKFVAGVSEARAANVPNHFHPER